MLIQILLRRQFALFWRCVFPLRIHDYPWAFGSWHWSPGDDEFYPGHTVAQQATVACVCGRRKWGSLMYCIILMYVCIISPGRKGMTVWYFFVISHGFCNNYLKGRQELHRNNPHHFHLLSQWQSHHIPAPTWLLQHGDLGHEPQKQHSKSTASKCFKY